MYFEYLKERLGRDVVFDRAVDPRGFIVYSITPDKDLLIHDIYVKPDFRRIGVGDLLCAQVASIALLIGVRNVLAQCAVHSNDCAQSLQFCLKMGMKIVGADKDWILLEDKEWARVQHRSEVP